MSKKRILIRLAIILVLIALTVPTFAVRIKNENANNDVVMALNYNNYEENLSDSELLVSFDENKKIGVNTVLIGEESANSLINSGFVTVVNYNVLAHKYDEESEQILRVLGDNEKIHDDSFVFITKRDEAKEFLSKWIKAKYTEDEYFYGQASFGTDFYVLYEENGTQWQVMTGFKEEKIKTAHENGFDIALSMLVGSYNNTQYIDEIDKLVKKYDIKYLNLKQNLRHKTDNSVAKNNYNKLAKVIEDNNMTLVLTENEDQLSNQKPVGYEKLIDSAKGRVIRCYDTTDYLVNKSGATEYTQAYYKIINSVVDRNIRFVNINQLSNGNDTFAVKDEKTTMATKLAIDKLREFGYNIGEMDTSLEDYSINRRLISALGMLVMILMWLTIIELLCGKTIKPLEIIAYAGALASVAFTFIAPESIVLLYPSLYAITMPCFCITVVFAFIARFSKKMALLPFTVSVIAITTVLFLVTGIVQSSLLSGADYYLNSLIFRGIKLSLIVPILFSAVAYFIIDSQENGENPILKFIEFLNTNIKVYWVALGVVVAAVGVIYIIRSGNVKEISGLESALRNTITEKMLARPRTKEFLVGWPCLMLLTYYASKTNCKLMRFMLSLGSSILFASVINTFCHVFTDAGVVYSRVLNGLGVGLIVSAGLYLANAIVVSLVKYIIKKGKNKWNIS